MQICFSNIWKNIGESKKYLLTYFIIWAYKGHTGLNYVTPDYIFKHLFGLGVDIFLRILNNEDPLYILVNVCEEYALVFDLLRLLYITFAINMYAYCYMYWSAVLFSYLEYISHCTVLATHITLYCIRNTYHTVLY